MKSANWLFYFGILLLATRAAGQTCTVTAVSVHFGDYDTLSPQDATGSINVICDQPTIAIVKLDPGQNAGGSFQPRKMLGLQGGKTLAYNLYTDASHSRIWGDGTSNTHVQTGLGELIVYGYIPARQNVPSGLYTDMVVVTAEW